MGRKIFFGVLWTVVIYFLACVIVGGVAGSIAGAANPKIADAAGRLAGAEAVAAYLPFIIGGSLVIALFGTWKGILPGTKSK